jgi:hypothetical protein
MSDSTKLEAAEARSPAAELKRIDFTGTIWFAAAIIAAAIPLAALLSAGWRPADLPASNDFAWWFGSVLVTGGLVGLAYAGCPAKGATLEGDERIKSFSIRAGMALFGVGGMVALLALLLSPA